jgi:hypothetical protein
MNYKEAIIIDRNDLDTELANQPGIFLEVAQAYTQAISVRDGLKESLDSLGSSIDLRIRREAVDHGEKLTEALVKARVESNKTYRQHVEDYLAAKAKAEDLFAVKEAFAQRAFVLKDLCGLYIAGYFSTTAVKGKEASEIQYEGYLKRRAESTKSRRRRE